MQLKDGCLAYWSGRLRALQDVAAAVEVTRQALHLDSYGLNLIFYDAKTHFTLWSTIGPVEGAFRKVTFEKNYATGMATLMTQLKKLTATIGTVADSRK